MKTNLARRVKPLIGRQEERKAIEQGLQSQRCVQICGLMGIGKTHLARIAASQKSWNEVWWCDVRNGRCGADISRIVASVLGGLEIERLVSALQARGPVLLALDGADQLSGDAYALLAQWRQACPELALLLTARHARWAEPVTVVLGPLAPECVETIFWDRLGAMFATQDDEEGAQRAFQTLEPWLDGHPLSVELAASVVAVQRHGNSWEEHLPLRGNAEHHLEVPGVLRAVFQWSMRWLQPLEQQLLLACSVFQGPCSQEQVAFVAQRTPQEITTSIEVLLRMGLLRREQGACWILPPSVGSLVQQQTPRAELERLWRLQTRYYLSREGGVEGLVYIPRNCSRASKRIWREQEELYGLYERLLTFDQGLAVELALLLCHVLFYRMPGELLEQLSQHAYEYTKTHAEEDVRFCAAFTRARVLHVIVIDRAACDALLDELETLPFVNQNERVRAQVLFQRGTFDSLGGAHPKVAQQQLEEVLELALRNELHAVAIAALHKLAYVHLQIKEPARSLECFEHLAQLATHPGMEGQLLYSLLGKAELDAMQGRMQEAVVRYEQVLALCDEFGEIRSKSVVHYLFGYALYGLSEHTLSHQHLAQCVELERSLGGGFIAGHAIALRGLLALEQRDIHAVETHYRQARETLQCRGDDFDRNSWWTFGVFSLLARALGEVEQSREHTAQRERSTSYIYTRESIPWGRKMFDLLLELAALEAEPGSVDHPSLWQRLTAHEETPKDKVSAQLNPLFWGLGHWWRSRFNAPSDTAPTLQLQSDGGAFRWNGGVAVSIARRSALKRILCALADCHEEQPGTGLDLDALFEVGWPGEKASFESSQARVYNTISRLRKLGLSDVLAHNGDGYAYRSDLVLVRRHSIL